MEKIVLNTENNHAGEAGIVMNNLTSVPVISLHELEAQGYRLAVTTANRFVDSRHLSKLSSLEEVKREHGFRHYGEVCLAANCGGTFALADLNGKPLPADADLSKTLIIVDGQHRSAVAIANGWDLQYLLLPHIDNLVDYIKTKNTNGQSWKTQDFRHSYAVISGKKDVLAEKVTEAANILPGGTESYYNCALLKGEEVRKEDILKGKLPDYDEKTGDDMMQLLEGLAYVSRDDKNLRRAILKRSFLKALFQAANRFEGEATKLGLNCKAFFLSLTKEDKAQLTKDLMQDTPNFKMLKEGLAKLKADGEDAVQNLIDDKAAELNEMLEKNKKEQGTKKSKRLQSILAHQEDVLADKESKATKAQKRVEKAEQALEAAKKKVSDATDKVEAAKKADEAASGDKKKKTEKALEKAQTRLQAAQGQVAKVEDRLEQRRKAAEEAKADHEAMVAAIAKAESSTNAEEN